MIPESNRPRQANRISTLSLVFLSSVAPTNGLTASQDPRPPSNHPEKTKLREIQPIVPAHSRYRSNLPEVGDCEGDE